MVSALGKKRVSVSIHTAGKRLWRKCVFTASLCILAWPAQVVSAPAQAPPAVHTGANDARVVTMTYLKSAPGKLGQLERYVRANWFAMDRVAVERGLFLNYMWLDTGTDEGPWNAIVMVTYRDAQGFAGIERDWREIKAAHRDVLIDGETQADLGRVVESREFFERSPFVSVVAAGMPIDQAAADEDSREDSAIRELVGKYFEAGVTGSPELIREAFMPTARIEGMRGDRLVAWSFGEYLRFFTGTPAPGADQVERTITRVMRHGNSATVQLRLRFSPTQALDEQLSLLRIDGRWKIAYKSYVPSL